MPEKTPHSGGNIKSTGFCLSDVKKVQKLLKNRPLKCEFLL